jgi:hypothetical protein
VVSHFKGKDTLNAFQKQCAWREYTYLGDRKRQKYGEQSIMRSFRKDNMGRTCSMHGKYVKCIQNISLKT